LSLESCLEHIAGQSNSLSYPVLTELADLSPAELGRFAKAWLKVPPERKWKVIDGLVECAEQNAEVEFSAIFKLCLKDPEEAVRQRAIGGLWEYEDRSLIPTLVEILESDCSGEVRASAATALGKFAALAQDGKLLPKDAELVETSLMKGLKNEGEWLEVRRRALESVAVFRSPVVTEFIHWAYDSDDQKLRCSSIYAMGKTGQPQWLSLLFRELQNPSSPVRYEAAHACGELDDEQAAPHLIPLLQDDDTQVQLAAVGALGEVGGPLARRALRRCLKWGDPVLEDAARSALESIEAMEDPLGFVYDA
jgi:HEAT repeat protein